MAEMRVKLYLGKDKNRRIKYIDIFMTEGTRSKELLKKRSIEITLK